MAVYRMTGEKFEELPETSFEAENIREREDLQRILRDQPDVLEEGLLIVSDEYGDWQESNRRIDLLALDENGRLVVVELKRSDRDSFMDMQATRYASMVANMTVEQVVEAHRRYIQKRGISEDAQSRIREHLGSDDEEIHISTGNPRIILVSANFSKELTTHVLWLNQRDIDITCVKLQPSRVGDELFVERSQVIPVPEASDYMVRLRDREKEAEKRGSNRPGTSSGGDAFREAIESAHEDQRDRLERLYAFAVSLEQEGIASLSTRAGSYNTVLRIRLPNDRRALVNIFKNESGWGYLMFNGSLFEQRAPKSKNRIEGVLGPDTVRPNSTLWELPDGFLEALTDAYREASGVL